MLFRSHAHLTGAEDVTLVQRLRQSSVYHPTFENYDTLTKVEAYDQVVVGLHTSKMNSSLLTIFHDVDRYVGVYTPVHGVNAYHFAPFYSDNSSILIAYSTAESVNKRLQLVALNGSTRIGIGFSDHDLLVDFTKIQVFPLREKIDSWIVVGNNRDSGIMQVFKVVFSNGRITCNLTRVVDNVYTFSGVFPDNTDLLFIFNLLLPWKEQPSLLTINIKDESKTRMIDNFLKPIRRGDTNEVGWRFYKIESILCERDNSTHFYCIINYDSPFSYEYIFKNTDGSGGSTNFYFKLPGYESTYLQGSPGHFVQLAQKNHFGTTTYVVYKRITHGGSSDVYYTQDNDAPRDFAMTADKNGQSRMQLLTGFQTAPLFFLNVGPFMLNISKGGNISKAVLTVDGLPGQTHSEIAIGDIIDHKDVIYKPVDWWPFVVILALLLVIALGYVSYNNFKAPTDSEKSEIDHTDKYMSLKPEKEEVAAN